MKNTLPFHSGELQAQSRWSTSDLWTTTRQQQLLWKAIPPEIQPRIESAPFFFLATSDNEGHCDCSFKGGGPGLIRLIDDTHFAFPDFSGNGVFMSLGNILVNPNVGCLFIDFSDGARLRINGRAEIVEGDMARKLFTDADRVILVTIEPVVPNCSAHIPRLIFNQDDVTQESPR